MKFGRIFAVLFALGMLAIFSLLVFWFFLGGRERVRSEIVSNLQPILGETFDIASISLYPHSVVFHDVTLDPAPTLHIHLKAASIRLSPYALLQGASDWQGAIEEIELIEPRLSIATPDSVDTLASLFAYKPYALKKLSLLTVISRIRVLNGSIARDKFERLLVDQITGQVELTDPRHATLNMTALMPYLEGTAIEVDGSGDVTTGDFFASLRSEIPELEELHFQNMPEDIEITKGNLFVELDVWGGADVRFNGEIIGDSIGAKIGDKIDLSGGKLSGKLFGQTLEVSGSVTANNNPLDFAILASDIFRGSWSSRVAARVDLATIPRSFPESPGMEGTIDVTGEANGRGRDWGGMVTLTSDAVSIAGIELRRPRGVLNIKNGLLTTEDFTADFGNGAIALSGEADPVTGDIDLQGDIQQSLDGLPRLIAANRLSLAFGITRKEGVWFGGGEGGIFDSAGTCHARVGLSIRQNEFQFDIIPVGGKRGYIGVNYNPKDKTPLHITAREPQFLLQDIVKPGTMPDLVYEYSVKVDAEGTFSDIEGSFAAEGGDPTRGLEAWWSLSKSQEGWKGDARTTVKLPNRQVLKGIARLSLSERSFDLLQGSLRSETGEKVMEGRGRYLFADRRFDKVDVECEDLPIVELMRLVVDDVEPGLDAEADFKIKSEDGKISWGGVSRLVFPDSARYSFAADGRIEPNSLTVLDMSLLSATGDSVFFSASGSYNFSSGVLDSVVVSLTQFNSTRAIEIFAPQLKEKFGGVLNARLEVSGEFPILDVSTDIHLTSGLLFGEPGYWANIAVSGESGVFDLTGFNLGHLLMPLISGAGQFDAKEHKYKLTAAGENVEIKRLVQALSGVDLPLQGNGEIRINFDDAGEPGVARASVQMRSGSLANFEFRGLTAKLSLSGLKERDPVLHFDSLVVDWGDVIGTVNGELPFGAGRSIDMLFALNGRLTSFLPRLAGSFSNPKGSGRLHLRMGGDSKNPRLLSGEFLLNNGAFQLDQVIREVRKLEADVSLDSTGDVRINRFDFQIDSAPVRISNREADVSAGEEPITVYGYDLGVIRVETAADGFWIVVPGLMEPSWGGYLALKGIGKERRFEFRGPSYRPLGIGTASLHNAIITYPPFQRQGKPSRFAAAVLDLLKRIRWDARVTTDLGCRYFREVSGLGELPAWEEIKSQIGGGLLNPDLKIIVDLRVDDNPVGLSFNGSFNDTLRLSGELTSSQGSVEFLWSNFQVEKVGVQFNPALIDPVLYGTAATTVLDSSNISRQVRIRAGSGSTGGKLLSGENSQRAHFSDLTLLFEDDQGHSQEQILALLGYTPELLPGKLSELGGQFALSATPLKKWQRGLERRLEQWTGLDRVAVQTNLPQNFIERQFNPADNLNQQGGGSYWNLLYGSRVTLGKYVAPNLYLSYTGALASQAETYSKTRLGIQHSWDANYRLTRISNNLVLNYRYEYNELARSSVNSMSIRYGWVFDLQTRFVPGVLKLASAFR